MRVRYCAGGSGGYRGGSRSRCVAGPAMAPITLRQHTIRNMSESRFDFAAIRPSCKAG